MRVPEAAVAALRGGQVDAGVRAGGGGGERDGRGDDGDGGGVGHCGSGYQKKLRVESCDER